MSLITHPNARELTKSVRATVLVFKDPRSQELLSRIERLAPSEANTLIIGETGTGKELVARHIHHLSRRGREPFVAVNCGAFAETLVESELFGHEKGAFTGATTTKAGWFETANGGTLFLDEIGDLPLNIQVKLLRVLQEREVVRLGSRTPIPINVRLVAATNVNLADAVVAGHFREDLFYRLHVATIRLPPLRERPGDILPLAEFFIEEHCRRLGYERASLSPDTERKLLAHSWPGNIRELENAIHHALLVCRQQVVAPADLHLVDMRPQGSLTAQASQVAAPTLIASPPNLESALLALFEQNVPDLYEHIEETVFREAYRYCHGNQLQTGRLLNISRNIVRARLEKIGELSKV
ncbi:sigma-54-dependent Fis family transcriptional regulator [Pseudomonas capeferrum]|uniref:sigma-54 interaction domain-containing protein n=1 Tax=Pseudomonas capeferrum TaxID=1495066 RepID=UPI0015E33F62|nr:sigma-54 dependent transcriptional regulator [Pseudomonas capeferrum]MBA1201022.1 sigma-54-dependent Fis family transcriptional regulator [Pseudomonas capeferrum]